MIRRFRPDDLADLRRVCLLTGENGGDATGRWSSDDLLADVFLEPYVTLEPDHAWVVEQDGRAVGYLVATLDTAAFVRRWRQSWTPEFAARHGGRAVDPAEQWLHDLSTEPERMLSPRVDEFPAHLHIDLLPEAQGSGNGRALMRQLGLAAAEAGAPGIHLWVNRANAGALAFYDRLGFRELAVRGDTVQLGITSEHLGR